MSNIIIATSNISDSTVPVACSLVGNVVTPIDKTAQQADLIFFDAITQTYPYPESNVQNIQLTNIVRSASTSMSLWYDLTSNTTNIDLIAVLGHNLKAGDSVVITGGTGASGAMTGVTTITNHTITTDEETFGYLFIEYPQGILYDNIIVTCTRGSGTIDIGRIYLSSYWKPTYNIPYNWSLSVVDPSIINKSLDSSTFVTIKRVYRALSFDLAFVSLDEMYTKGFDLAYYKGIHGDTLIIPDVDNIYKYRQSIYGRISQLTPIINHNYNFYKQKFTIEEIL